VVLGLDQLFIALPTKVTYTMIIQFQTIHLTSLISPLLPFPFLSPFHHHLHFHFHFHSH
jgi:hypothetical protein